MNVEQLSEKIAALYFFIFLYFSNNLLFSFQFIQYRPLSCVLIYMKKIEIIELPKIYDPRGSLTVAEENTHIPFDIKRMEWIHLGAIQPETPIELEESPVMLIALAGEITIQVIDKDLSLEYIKSSKHNVKSIDFNQPSARTITLNHPHQALILKEGCRSRITHSTKHSLLLTIHQK